MKLLKTVFIALIGSFFMASALAASDDAGLLLSVKGPVDLISGTHTVSASPFKYLKHGDHVRLGEGGLLTLTFYAKKTLYYVVGPSELELGEHDVITVSGNAPTAKSMQENQVRAASISQDQARRPGSMNLRGLTMIELIEPQPWTMVLSEHPNFAWSSNLPVPYEIVILDADGKEEITRATVTEPRWSIDHGLLKAGTSYTWRVMSGAASSPTRVFSIASETDRQEIEAARPNANDDKDTWLLFVAALKAKRLDDEAKSALSFIKSKWPETVL